jgi:predicted AAA+ superfamily ATPase
MIARDTYFTKLDNLRDKQIIKVLTGVRRCGKSTILDMFRQHLLATGVLANQIQVFNFEDLGLSAIKDYLDLYKTINANLLPNEMNYIFLDEIQTIPHFEKAVDSLYLKNNVDIYLTGSNAFMLSGELATLLSGRYLEIPVYPLSFKEFQSHQPGIQISSSFEQYLERGGFPFATELPDDNTYLAYVQGIVNTVLVKDILGRMKRGNANLLEQIAAFLTYTAGNLITPSKISNTLTSKGLKTSNMTVSSYLDKLVSAFLFYRCDRFDLAGKKYLQTNSKYYYVDTALRRALLGQKRPNMGSRLENIVFMELKRRGYQVYVGTLGSKEVDFVAIHDGLRKYFQVSVSVAEQETYQREIAPLLEIKDNYPKVLLTQDPGKFNDNGIEQINVIDWLLE